jgi:DNA-binding CsgD family transcriptional regulator
VLHGREVERARLVELIEAARGGTAGALVVHGEPGVGKSALLADFLRRHQRRVDARGHLRGALETFEDLRAVPLADRARQELRASGETARKRDPSTALNLTPMELKVAELVSQGLSNKDAAAQCWVSPRTVAFHLRNVFTKTGVTSRSELTHVPLR